MSRWLLAVVVVCLAVSTAPAVSLTELQGAMGTQQALGGVGMSSGASTINNVRAAVGSGQPALGGHTPVGVPAAAGGAGSKWVKGDPAAHGRGTARGWATNTSGGRGWVSAGDIGRRR